MKNSAFLFALSLTFATFGVQTAVADVVYDDNVQGKEHAIGVILAWSTAVETNNMQFVVERSEDGGKTYAAVGTVKGAGNSTTRRNYNFLDAQASAANKVSYRLRQFDLDGTTNLSDVFTMTRKVQNLFTVVKMSPEGVAKAYNFTIDASYDGALVVFLKDASAKTVFQKTYYVRNGLNDFSIDMSDKPEGTYKVVLSRANEEETLVMRKSLDEVDRRTNVATNKSANGKN